MKVTTGALERQTQDHLQKANGFAVGGYQQVLSRYPDLSLVLCFVRVLFTTCSMRQYLKPNQIAQVIQLIQNGTSIRAITKKFGVSPSTVS